MQEVLGKVTGLIRTFEQEAAKAASGNKAAGTRARKLSLELTKALKEFRAVSVGV